MHYIESFLSARLFVRPQLVGDSIYFLSNLSGQISLYRINFGGSIPDPLLPPHIALQNPHLMDGKSFFIFPSINQIVVMIDNNGDENYKPMVIPLSGGFPEPIFQDEFENSRVILAHCDPITNQIYLVAAKHDKAIIETYQANLESLEIIKLAESTWGKFPISINSANNKIIIGEEYSHGDSVLYLMDGINSQPQLIYGTPLEKRTPDQNIPLTGFSSSCFVSSDQAILVCSTIFEDAKSLGFIDLRYPQEIKPVSIIGKIHSGNGEMVKIEKITDTRFLLEYNIDGCSWLYEGEFDQNTFDFNIKHTLCGENVLSNGVLDSFFYDERSDRFITSFSSAKSPTQIYTISGNDIDIVERHTNEKILGISDDMLSSGEDASYTTFDGQRISARLYLPASPDYNAPYPLIYYVHGGPQGQERPDFAWFSMPLIQFLTLNGFAVFVPNVRGSTGYGLNYTKLVDKDWGGDDRLDHIHAMEVVLPEDKRLDTTRTGVVGRSYGGYMSLTLASRHPDFWKAAVDMFGPYNLVTFADRIPETWKPYFNLVLGDPSNPEDKKFLLERSPETYMPNIKCPLLVIQGKNDPRVVEKESGDLVNYLRSQGKKVDYLVFENEGHDVLKYENRVKCYNTITDFFIQHLKSI